MPKISAESDSSRPLPHERSATAPSAGPGPGAPRPRRHWTLLIVLILFVGGVTAVWWFNHRTSLQPTPGMGGRGSGGRGGSRGSFFGNPNAPLPVGVRAVEKGDIHLYLDALGTVTPAHVATIRTQISGQLMQIGFQEGQFVHQGDLLAVIDPRPYQNSLQQAQAQLRQAQSQLNIAETDLQRYEALAKEDSISKQQVDTTRAQVAQYEGLVQAAQAAIATANLNITYCNIKAPFDGRVGLRLVDQGNYITPGDSSGIVVLTQVKPITVVFTLPEDNMGAVVDRIHAGKKLAVDAFDRSQTKKLATGVLLTTDNVIDASTGTFKLRAEFANDDESLFPNQFVNVRLLLDTITGATVIPTSAVERGQQGTFVYAVEQGENGATATARPITLGATEGERVAVTAGLNPGDQIVVDGADRLKDGQKILVSTPGGPEPEGARGGRGGPAGAGGKKWEGKRGGKKGGGAADSKD